MEACLLFHLQDRIYSIVKCFCREEETTEEQDKITEDQEETIEEQEEDIEEETWILSKNLQIEQMKEETNKIQTPTWTSKFLCGLGYFKENLNRRKANKVLLKIQIKEFNSEDQWEESNGKEELQVTQLVNQCNLNKTKKCIITTVETFTIQIKIKTLRNKDLHILKTWNHQAIKSWLITTWIKWKSNKLPKTKNPTTNITEKIFNKSIENYQKYTLLL